MIDITRITPRQKLIIETGLLEYRYVMKYWQLNDADFQDVYHDLYLRARGGVMRKEGNKKPYFDKLQNISSADSLIDIIEDLKESMEQHCYEFSLSSKLLHTRNPLSPIYDSKVREYLSREENVHFWWNRSGAPRGTTEIEKIRHDWQMLNDWYEAMLDSDRGRKWIEWFDSMFPEDSEISNVKKIDWIIFAAS